MILSILSMIIDKSFTTLTSAQKKQNGSLTDFFILKYLPKSSKYLYDFYKKRVISFFGNDSKKIMRYINNIQDEIIYDDECKLYKLIVGNPEYYLFFCDSKYILDTRSLSVFNLDELKFCIIDYIIFDGYDINYCKQSKYIYGGNNFPLSIDAATNISGTDINDKFKKYFLVESICEKFLFTHHITNYTLINYDDYYSYYRRKIIQIFDPDTYDTLTRAKLTAILMGISITMITITLAKKLYIKK